MSAEMIDSNSPPPAQAGNSDPPRHAVWVTLKMPRLLSAGQGAIILGNMLGEIITRSLAERGLLRAEEACQTNGFSSGKPSCCGACGDLILGLFEVTDYDPAVLAVRAQLESIQALPISQIGYMDGRSGDWEVWHPSGPQATFQDALEQINKWADILEPKSTPPQPPTAPPTP
jgi:hypothetical protein